jgi:hypothetical protein
MVMRTIKFRVWDGEVMIYDIQNAYDMYPLNEDNEENDTKYEKSKVYQAHSFGDILRQDWDVMQFTGLKDKNGTEIYEKDLIRHPDSGLVYCIRWNIDTASYEFFNTDNSDRLMAHFQSMANYCEVIGDIYSNPELIK